MARSRWDVGSQRWVFLCACWLALAGPYAHGSEEHAWGPADTSSPRATLKSFIDSCNAIYRFTRRKAFVDRSSPELQELVRRTLDCLDTRQLPEYAQEARAAEVAICIKEILDRVVIPPVDEIPGTEEVATDREEDRLDRWRIPGTRITIARVEEGPQRDEYLFSAGTVALAVEYYDELKYRPYRTSGPEVSQGFYQWYVSAPRKRLIGLLVDRLPKWTLERKLGVALWKWPAIIVLALLTPALMGWTYRLQRTMVARVRDRGLVRYWLTLIFPIAAMLIPLGAKWFAEEILTLRGSPLYVFSFAANLLAFLASLVAVFALSNRATETVLASPRIHPQGLDAQFIRIVSKLLSLVASTIIFLEGGRYLGIPVTTLLAGAGVGGLALALAAQGTVKDLLGTMMILLDRPYRVGDRIVFKHYDGFVEEIGLRSTKLRLLTGHLAAIPNDVMAHHEIENVGKRRHIRRVAKIHIPLETPREKVAQAVDAIRDALKDHEGMNEMFPPRVFFNEFNPDSFNILVLYWYTPPDYWAFLGLSERVNMAIMKAFEELGIRFSLPRRVTYTGTDSQPRPLEVAVER